MNILEIPMTRREFLRLGTAAAAVLLFGCRTKGESPKLESTPSFVEITNDDIQNITRVTVKHFNEFLGFNLSEEEVAKHVLVASDIYKYQELIADNQGYIPGFETRPAITTDPDFNIDPKIILYKPAIEEQVRQRDLLSEGNDRQKMSDFIENIMMHELSHWVSPLYSSDELHNLVYNHMFADFQPYKGKRIEKRGVRGAEVSALLENQQVSHFQTLEEAEAITISNFVMAKLDKPYLTAAELQVGTHVDLLNDLLKKLNPDFDEAVKTLATLRAQPNGRKELCSLIAKKFNVDEQTNLLFCMSLLFSIDQGDTKTYQNLTRNIK